MENPPLSSASTRRYRISIFVNVLLIVVLLLSRPLYLWLPRALLDVSGVTVRLKCDPYEAVHITGFLNDELVVVRQITVVPILDELHIWIYGGIPLPWESNLSNSLSQEILVYKLRTLAPRRVVLHKRGSGQSILTEDAVSVQGSCQQ